MITHRQLQAYLEHGRKKGAAIELCIQEQQEDSLVVRNKEIEQVQSSLDRGLGVRVILGSRFGFSYTTALNEADIFRTIDQALANAECAMPDKYLRLPLRSQLKSKPQLNNFDKDILKLAAPKRVGMAAALEAAAYAYDKRIVKTDSATFATGLTSTLLVNSAGAAATQKSTWAGLSLEIIAEEKGIMEAAYDYQYATSLKVLSPELVGRNAAKLAVTALSAGDVATGTYDLVLPPRTAVSLLSVIASLFSAEMVQKKKSLLRGKRMKKIASPKVSIVDDPFYLGQLGSFLYDGEGVPGKKTRLVRCGVLQGYLYDTYTAAKDGVPSTGNAIRGSIKSEPTIGPSNLYIVPGGRSPEMLVAGVKKAFSFSL